MRLLFLIIFYQVSITSHMGSDTDVQPSLCLERELSRLQEILRTKQETCSEVRKVADEQADEKGKRRAKKEAEREELRRKLSRIISEQEEERNRHIEDSAAGPKIFIQSSVEFSLADCNDHDQMIYFLSRCPRS